jgi:hypothetical protein
MSIITDSTSINSLAELLASSVTGSSDSTSTADSSEFEAALESALVSMGYSAEDVDVQVGHSTKASGGGRQITITLGSEESVSETDTSTDTSTDTETKPVSPFAAAAPALRGLSAESTATSDDSTVSLEYDPSRGPQITKDMWTEEMLTGELTADLLKNIQDPAAFLTARLEAVQRKTDATVVSEYDGSSSSVNPSLLSTLDQAAEIRDRLISLGLDVGEIEEIEVNGGPFSTDWGTEDRRMYVIDGMSVGLIVEKYARNTVERADQMILDQYNLA